MKMALTRLGENSRMVVTGDLSQIDLPKGAPSGLRETAGILADVEGVACVQFTAADVVRHALVTRIVRAYAAVDAGKTGEGELFGRERGGPAHATNDERRSWDKYGFGDRSGADGRRVAGGLG